MTKSIFSAAVAMEYVSNVSSIVPLMVFKVEMLNQTYVNNQELISPNWELIMKNLLDCKPHLERGTSCSPKLLDSLW